jgi:hypothetical protein
VKAFIKLGLETHKNNQQLMGATKNQGFFKIAYVYSFYFLRHVIHSCRTEEELSPEVYKDVMKRTISEGGDTDTNACIVGGLIGSIVGYKQLPKEYLDKMLHLKLFNTVQLRRNIKQYEPKNGLKNLICLIKKFI